MTKPYDHEGLWLKGQGFPEPGYGRDRRASFDEQALWASLALEPLAKAALARVSPLLIAEPSEDGTNLLIASGLTEGDAKLMSVTAKTLYSRCQKAFKPFDESEAGRITHARNEYLHGSAVGFTSIPAAAWWPRYWTLAVILVGALERAIEDLVGEDRTTIVERHLEQNQKNIEHRTEMLIERAKQRLAQWKAGTLPAKVAAEWSPGISLTAGLKYSEPATCPACGGQGVIEGDDSVDVQVRYEQIGEEDFEATLDVTAGTDYFSCENCGLMLDNYQLVEQAGFDSTFDTQGDESGIPYYDGDLRQRLTSLQWFGRRALTCRQGALRGQHEAPGLLNRSEQMVVVEWGPGKRRSMTSADRPCSSARMSAASSARYWASVHRSQPMPGALRLMSVAWRSRAPRPTLEGGGPTPWSAARVRRPRDKPKVERAVQYVRGNFFAGETFTDLAQAQARAVAWCARTAGMRVHGTTAVRPAEVFTDVERACLLPVPGPYDVPVFTRVKVHRDFHVEVARALYSVSEHLLGQHLDARADSQLVKLSRGRKLVKTHPRQPPGGRSTDAGDLPAERAGYAMRDLTKLIAACPAHGANIGIYAERLLDDPLPWTRMRAVYRLLGLVRRYGSDPVQAACSRSLDVDVVSVTKIASMLERATEHQAPALPAAGSAGGRFAREAGEFAMRGGTQLTLIRDGATDVASTEPETTP